MTNTTRKLRVQKNILATTHCQALNTPPKSSGGTYSFHCCLLFCDTRLWFQPASSSTAWRKFCSQPQWLAQHRTLLCEPPVVSPIPLCTGAATMQQGTPTHHVTNTAEMQHISNCLSQELNHFNSVFIYSTQESSENQILQAGYGSPSLLEDNTAELKINTSPTWTTPICGASVPGTGFTGAGKESGQHTSAWGS